MFSTGIQPVYYEYERDITFKKLLVRILQTHNLNNTIYQLCLNKKKTMKSKK